MSFPQADVKLIRELARRVAEIASDAVREERRRLWKRLNSLERVRPLIHVQAIAPNIWEELVPAVSLRCTDAFCRRQETDLRRRIYCWEHFQDDRVVEDSVVCPISVNGDLQASGFGMKRVIEPSAEPSGAYAIANSIVEERDIENIRTEAEIAVDWEGTERQYECLGTLYDGILRVEKRGRDFFWMPVMDTFIQWRGIEQMFVDLLERPAWVHEALERITTGFLNNLRELERLKVLSLGNGNTLLGSGGYGCTDELPQEDFDGSHVRIKDLWGRCATQIFTDGISPEMHDELAIRYEKRLLEAFGLATYGCCEPLHKKMHVVRKIKNLRRVSMSPWVDLEQAAEAVGTDFVYTHKPNPTIVSMESWHPEAARAELREALVKTRGNVVEVNLQDLHTVRGEPHRLTEWTRMAMELSEAYA